MKTLIIEGYLTQDKLYKTLKAIFPSAKPEVPVKQRKLLRWDVMLEHEGNTFVVEYDGDSHYRDHNVQKRDEFKKGCANSDNFKLVRIPYFIQLTNESFEYYFGFSLESLGYTIKQDFPHGFIDKKVVYPINFNTAGTNRMLGELEDFNYKGSSIAKEVISSLLETSVPSNSEFKLTDTDKVCKETQEKYLVVLYNYQQSFDDLEDRMQNSAIEELIYNTFQEPIPTQDELGCPHCVIENLIKHHVYNKDWLYSNLGELNESIKEAIKLIKFAYTTYTHN